MVIIVLIIKVMNIIVVFGGGVDIMEMWNIEVVWVVFFVIMIFKVFLGVICFCMEVVVY